MKLKNKQETALVLAGLCLLQQKMQDAPQCLPPSVALILDEVDVGEGAVDAIDRICDSIAEEEEPIRDENGNIVSHIIVSGNPVDGFRYTGPFVTYAEAEQQAEGWDIPDWWISDLRSPDNS